ncbi:MAG: hypothetical protein NC093_02685 [Alistipes sp.]|nr:hypothetical protein [Alistipes sp.]
MGFNKKLLAEFFKDKFIRDFLDNSDYQDRLNVSIISSICMELINTPAEKRTDEMISSSINSILNQCCQPMKKKDIFLNLKRACNDEEFEIKVIGLKQLLTEFSEECDRCLNSNVISFVPGEIVCIETCKDMLLCLMILYVRRAVTEGAGKIRLSYRADEKKAEIILDIIEKGVPMNVRSAENISLEYAYDFIDCFAEKLECIPEISANGLKLEFKLKNNGNLNFQSPEPEYGKKIFSIYNNFLADIGNITLI